MNSIELEMFYNTTLNLIHMLIHDVLRRFLFACLYESIFVDNPYKKRRFGQFAATTYCNKES